MIIRTYTSTFDGKIYAVYKLLTERDIREEFCTPKAPYYLVGKPRTSMRRWQQVVGTRPARPMYDGSGSSDSDYSAESFLGDGWDVIAPVSDWEAGQRALTLLEEELVHEADEGAPRPVNLTFLAYGNPEGENPVLRSVDLTDLPPVRGRRSNAVIVDDSSG